MTELEVVKFFNALGQGTIIDWLTIGLSNTIFLTVLWLTLSILILWRDQAHGKKIILAIVAALILNFVINDWLIPFIFGFRLRPFIAFPDTIHLIGPPIYETSFPSGHMSSSLAILTPMLYYYRRYWPYALVFALLMAFARLHNGVHYPSDILAGTILGILYGFIGIWLALKILDKK